MTATEWLASLEEPIYPSPDGSKPKPSAKVLAEEFAMFQRAQGILQSG